MKLAILGCSSSKQDYPCYAQEMYSKYIFKRVQLGFLKTSYDKVLILSGKYGLVELTEIIEPYEISFTYRKRVSTPRNVATSEYKKEWGKKVIHQLEPYIKEYSKIDFHVSNAYYDPIKTYCNSKSHIYKVSQQINPGENKKRYLSALDYYFNNNKIDLSIIEKPTITNNPELEKYFFHQNHPPHLGYTRSLIKKYPKLDEGTIHMLSKGKIPHHKGWVIDQSLLGKLYKTESGQWRVKKS
jgi:hypothetical protein